MYYHIMIQLFIIYVILKFDAKRKLDSQIYYHIMRAIHQGIHLRIKLMVRLDVPRAIIDFIILKHIMISN